MTVELLASRYSANTHIEGWCCQETRRDACACGGACVEEHLWGLRCGYRTESEALRTGANEGEACEGEACDSTLRGLGSSTVGWVAPRGRNASRRLGGDGPQRRRSGLQATRGLRQRRVCSRGPGLRAMETAAAAPGLASSNLVQWKVSNEIERKGNGAEGARRILSWLNASLQCLYATFIGCCSALRGCKYEGVNTTSLRVSNVVPGRAHVTAARASRTTPLPVTAATKAEARLIAECCGT